MAVARGCLMIKPYRSLLPLILAAASCAVYDADLVGGLAENGGAGGSSATAGKGATQAGQGAGQAGSQNGVSGSATGGGGAAATAGTGPGGSSYNGGAGDEGGGGMPGDAGSAGYYGSETLLAYYQFDSGTGLQVIDSSGHGHDGTCASNPNSPLPIWTTGRLDGALSFAGQDFVQVPYSAVWNNINSANAYTIAAFSYRSVSKASWAMLLSRQYKTTTAEHFALTWRDGRAAALALTHIGQAPDTGPLDAWVHLAATYDGSTLKVYEDAVEVSSIAAAGPMWQDDTSTGLIIAGNVNAADPVGETFVGKLDELVIYSRVLTPAELTALAAAMPPPAE
jgi:hypothetical protein